MAIKDILQKNINRVAETHYFLKPELEKALEGILIHPAGKKILGNYDTYREYWIETLNDKFFDMTTFIRLGSVIETNFKSYYMDKFGHKTLIDLRKDSNYSQGIFQRVQSWQTTGVINLYKNVLGIDLQSNPKMIKIQEIMMHRHLYAHNSGLLDDEYIKKITQITGIDPLVVRPEIANAYVVDDVYWFEPIANLPDFIEDTRSFFRVLN